MNSKYDANSIETLNFRDAVRKRIEMYMGSADNQGVLQCAREVISNSIDEFSIGFGNRVDIEIIFVPFDYFIVRKKFLPRRDALKCRFG